MRLALFIIPVLVACNIETDPAATPALPAPGLERLAQMVDAPLDTLTYGCGDMHAFLYDADDTVALSVLLADGVVWEAANSGAEITRTYVLPHPDVTVSAKWGERVTVLDCNDAIDMNNMPVIDGTAEAVSGTIEVTIRPTGATDPWDFFSHADIQMSDVELNDPTTAQPPEFIDSAILEDVSVGWLPG